MKNILKISFLISAFLFSNFGTDASEKDKICPFELISFTHETIRDSVKRKLIVNLEWQTASEMNTDKFVLERFDHDVILLIQEKDFLPITEIQAAGTSSSVKTYNYIDTLILDLQPVSYRTKGVDKDSSFSYSNEIFIDNYTDVEEQNKPSTIIENIYPNPSNGLFNILLNTNDLDYINMSLYDSKGTLLSKTSNKASNSLINMDLSKFTSGEYYLNVSRGTKFEIRKITIIK